MKMIFILLPLVFSKALLSLNAQTTSYNTNNTEACLTGKSTLDNYRCQKSNFIGEQEDSEFCGMMVAKNIATGKFSIYNSSIPTNICMSEDNCDDNCDERYNCNEAITCFDKLKTDDAHIKKIIRLEPIDVDRNQIVHDSGKPSCYISSKTRCFRFVAIEDSSGSNKLTNISVLSILYIILNDLL